MRRSIPAQHAANTPASATAAVAKGWRFSSFSLMIRIATLCLCLYWLGIFVGTHLPSNSLPSVRMSDKLVHAGAFAGLAFLLAWAIPSSRPVRHAVIVLVVATTYGCLDELTQMFIPGRTCDRWDLLADFIGACLGLATYFVVRSILLISSAGRALIQSLSK